jgi:hypothetical protein
VLLPRRRLLREGVIEFESLAYPSVEAASLLVSYS